MKKRIWISILIIIIVIIGVIFIIQNNQIDENQEPIKIGAILPLTGKAAGYGESSKAALELALEEINKEGGVKGRNIEIIYEDTQGQPQIGVNTVNKLITLDGLKVILGPAMSSVTLAVAPIAEENKVILMTVSSSPDITNAGDYIFRNREKTNQQSEKMTDFIFNNLKIKKIATLYMNDDTGKSHHLTLVENFEKLGGTVLISETYEPGALDFKTQLTKIKVLNPKVIHLASKPKDVGMILRQAEELGIETQFVGTSGSEGEEVIELAGVVAEGLVYSLPAGDMNRAEVAEFYQKYKEKYEKGYIELGALFYDSLKIISQVMNACKNPIDTICLKQKLYQIKDYFGASGKTSFDKYGDATKSVILKTIKNGQFVPYEE